MRRETYDKSTANLELEVRPSVGDVGDQIMLISAASLAEQLDVSVRTVWRLLSSGKIPDPVKVGGSVRWRSNDIFAWIRDGCPERHGSRRANGSSRAVGRT